MPWEAVLPLIKSVSKKCIPLRVIIDTLLYKPPFPLEPQTPRPERGGGVNDRASHVSAAEAAIQTLPRKKKDKWKSYV